MWAAIYGHCKLRKSLGVSSVFRCQVSVKRGQKTEDFEVGSRNAEVGMRKEGGQETEVFEFGPPWRDDLN